MDRILFPEQYSHKANGDPSRTELSPDRHRERPPNPLQRSGGCVTITEEREVNIILYKLWVIQNYYLPSDYIEAQELWQLVVGREATSKIYIVIIYFARCFPFVNFCGCSATFSYACERD